MEDSLLEVTDLSVVYRSRGAQIRAVNHLNVAVRRGETLGLVGETGAGKTTTALSIMNILPERTGRITSGEIRYKGKNLLELPYKELRDLRGKEISMIFQDPMTSLNPIFPVGSQVGEVLKMHTDLNAGEIDEKVCDVLEMVGIPRTRRTDYPHQFSGGMKQRVVIAMALICRPELLIADEPTTALDVTIQAQVLDLMRTLKQELGTSMILITHDLGVVAETCDRVAVIYAGEVVETGTLADIFTGTDHHPYTEGLFGSLPDLKKKTRRLNPIPGLVPDPGNLPAGCYFAERCPKRMACCEALHPTEFTAGAHKILCHLYSAGQPGKLL